MIVGGFFLGGFFPVFATAVAKLLRIELEDGEAALVTRFGRLTKTLTEPGWHWVLDRSLPWTQVRKVGTKRDFRTIDNIQVNDARGTTVVVDIWVEFRVKDPAKACYAIEDWDSSLKNLISHSVMSILGNREFQEILCDRTELGAQLQSEILEDTARWGIQIEQVFIKDVSLLPEVAQEIFHSIAARLERAKADIEEEGRQSVALLQAKTDSKVATLVAAAKGQYALATGRALGNLRSMPRVKAAYEELYELSLVHPDRTVMFRGFHSSEVRAVDAVMFAPNMTTEENRAWSSPPSDIVN